MRRIVLAVVVAVFVLPAWASEPGEPMDCGEWIALTPGFTCTILPRHVALEAGGPTFDSETHAIRGVRANYGEYCQSGNFSG